MKMNRNILVGTLLVLAAVLAAAVVNSSAGVVATGLLGKAVWYIPYAFGICALGRFARAI